MARIPGATRNKQFDAEKEENHKLITSMYQKLRGYPPYWRSVKLDLRATIATYGPPSWFVTLNPNVTKWTDLHNLYNKVLGRVDVGSDTIEDAIVSDPTIFARYWRNRVNNFMRNVMLRVDGSPLGVVTHYFYRVEYQHRGTQHVHCLFWTQDRPAADASAAEYEVYLNKYLTCRMPDEKNEPELCYLVKNCQMHWPTHSNTCRRRRKIRGRWTTDMCRFGFPREPRHRTIYYMDPDAEKMPKMRSRPYYLARTKEEEMVNDYNPAMLLLWDGNIDVQYIPEGVKHILNYITGYTLKGEKAKRSEEDALARLAMQRLPHNDILWKIGYQMLENREAGMLEIVDDLLGHALYASDSAHIFIPNDAYDDRLR
uniref:ATP-dependent DNA helicase n=1 Tax=Caenorhabditis japonica TaxID=281687 RepID=A0A8R1EU63_CAEJA